jgi:hypothetical protein
LHPACILYQYCTRSPIARSPSAKGMNAMGWLRDLMQGAEPSYRSFGALARAALRHPAWPQSAQLQERSLSTLMSKLDHDTDVEWLSDRPEVQRVLAELLGCTVADVQAGVAASGAAPDRATRRVRLDDVRYARALDLAEELLPPGIPDAVQHPESWGRLWWLAPSGSGRSLAGRWLEARGLARHCVDEPARSPAPIFLELGANPGFAPVRDRICVAAAAPPPAGSGFTVVESPPLDAYLDDLVAWVAARLESDSALDVERTARWVRAEVLPRPELARFGIALGLIGLVDELGLRSLERVSLAQAARRYVELRLAEWRRNEDGDTSGIERRAFDVLVGMVGHTLADDDRPWSAPRHFDDWVASVPPEHQRGADLDWLRLSLPRVDRTIRPSDVERAARSMPPGAYRVVRALRGARLLAAGPSEDELSLGPRWLGAVAAVEAERAIVARSPLEWGEALLRPHAAAGVLRALVEKVATGDVTPLDAALEASDEDEPATVAALEAAFCAAGGALVDGQELPSELVDELAEEQARLRIELAGGSGRPRVLDAVLGPAWALAALAVSGQADLAAIEPLYRAAVVARAAAIAALVDRARRARGAAAGHRLELPGALVAAAEVDDVAFELVEALDEPERDSAAIERIAAERGVELERVAALCFRAWDRAGRPALPALARSFWMARHVPEPLLVAVVERAQADGFAFPWAALGDDARRTLAESASAQVLWTHFPDLARHSLDAALTAGELPRAIALLTASPGAAHCRSFRERAAIDRLSDRDLDALRAWLWERTRERAPGWREAYALLAQAERLITGSRLLTR